MVLLAPFTRLAATRSGACWCREAVAAAAESATDSWQYALLVAHDDVRRVQLEQPAQAVGCGYDAAVGRSFRSECR